MLRIPYSEYVSNVKNLKKMETKRKHIFNIRRRQLANFKPHKKVSVLGKSDTHQADCMQEEK